MAITADLLIRDAHAGDVEALATLLADLGYPEPADVVAARFAAFQAAGERALVAVRGDVVLGLATLHVTPELHRPAPVGRITALVVRDGGRGAGVGRALVAAAEEVLAAAGCGMVEVTSNRRRTDAHAFYERLGYEVTSLRFKKDLNPSPSARTA